MVIDLMYIFYGFLMFVSNRRSHLHAAHVSADLGPYAWSCPNGLRLVFTAKLSLSQFSGIHESEKRSPNALGRPTAKSANYQA